MKYLVTLFCLLLVLVSTIPYWTGQIAYHQIPIFNEKLFENIPLKFLDSHHEQGWLQSSVKSTFAIDTPTFDKYPFSLQHTIDHGFLPAQLPHIFSILSSDLPLCASHELLKLHTSFQMTGESISTLEVSPCAMQIEDKSIQWQVLQGEAHFTRDFSTVSGQLQNPQIQVKTGLARIIMQDVTAHYLLEQAFLAELDIMMSVLHISDNTTIELSQFKLKNTTHLAQDYLTVAINTHAQQAVVDTESYGPAYLDFSIQHLHLDTLKNILTSLQSLYGRDLSSLQRNFLLTTLMMQQMPVLLEHSPQLFVPHLNFQTQAGKVDGMLQIAVETFDRRVFFDPVKLTEMLAVEFKLQLPQSLLGRLAELSFKYQGITTTDDAVEQRVQFWLTEGFFIPSLEQPNYYQIQIHSQAGVLQLNEKKMLWQTVLRR